MNNIQDLALYLQPLLDRLSLGERAKLAKILDEIFVQANASVLQLSKTLMVQHIPLDENAYVSKR